MPVKSPRSGFVGLLSLLTLLASANSLHAQKIYWSDWVTDTIYCANRDGSDKEVIVDPIVNMPIRIAIDETRGHLYWLDHGRETITRSNLDGAELFDLPVGELIEPWGFALDQEGGKIYWSDGKEFSGRIQRANLDGSDVKVLVDAEVLSPRDLALDLERKQMYWVDQATGKIQRSKLNGEHIETVIQTDGLLTSIDVDSEHKWLFWTQTKPDGVFKSRLDGSEVEAIVTILTSWVRTIIALPEQQRVCWSTWDHWIDCANYDGANVSRIQMDPIHFSWGFAITNDHTHLYVTGSYFGSINRVDLSTGETIELLGPQTIPRYIALDLPNNKLYWQDYNNGDLIIQRANLDGSQAEIVADEEFRPSFNPATTLDGRVYWFDINTQIIYRSDVDGLNVEPIYATVGYVQGIVASRRHNRLFWIERPPSMIKSSNLDGSGVQIEFAEMDVYLGGDMAIDDSRDELYTGLWDGTEESIVRINITTGVLEHVTPAILPQSIVVDPRPIVELPTRSRLQNRTIKRSKHIEQVNSQPARKHIKK